MSLSFDAAAIIDPEPLAGTTTISATSGYSWVQVNCSLFFENSEVQFLPWFTLADALQRWKQEGLIERCFFVRKTPGVRIRFFGQHLYAKFMPALIDWLEENEKENNIRGFRFAHYEPETNRFGGMTGMEIAHDYFNLDSLACISYELLNEETRQALPKYILSAIALNDLFVQCNSDTAEVWDCWKQLHNLVDHAGTANVQDNIFWPIQPFMSDTGAVEELPEDCKSLVAVIKRNNEMISRMLKAAQISSSISIGSREWLIASAVFHWNRLGFNIQDIIHITGKMLAIIK